VKLPQLGFRIGVVETLHRLPVAVRCESFEPVVADPDHRRIMGRKFRKLRLESGQFPQQPVVVVVGNLRLGLPVVKLGVACDLGTEFSDASLGGCSFHRGN
jgi:hypothetical protein